MLECSDPRSVFSGFRLHHPLAPVCKRVARVQVRTAHTIRAESAADSRRFGSRRRAVYAPITRTAPEPRSGATHRGPFQLVPVAAAIARHRPRPASPGRPASPRPPPARAQAVAAVRDEDRRAPPAGCSCPCDSDDADPTRVSGPVSCQPAAGVS